MTYTQIIGISDPLEKPVNMSCSNCHFSKVQPDARNKDFFLCRRFPPSILPDSEYDSSMFPEVLPDWWCGEWRSV